MIKIFLLFGLLVAIGCTAKQTTGDLSVPIEISLDNRNAPIVLEKEKEFLFDRFFADPPVLACLDDKDFLYVYFLKNADGNCEILKYSIPDFQVKAQCILGRGQGPREAGNPRIYGGGTDPINIYDVMGHKILQYNSDLKYLSEYRVKDIGRYNYSGGISISSRRSVVDSLAVVQEPSKNDTHPPREKKHILVERDFYKSKDTILFAIKSPFFRSEAGGRVIVVSRPLHFCVVQNFYYILDKRDYRLLKMNMNGKIVKDIKIKFKHIAVSRQLRKKWLVELFKPQGAAIMDYEEEIYPALWILPFYEGILVGRCTDHDPSNMGPVKADYFDKDLNFKGQLELPYFPGWNAPTDEGEVGGILYYINKRLYFFEERGDEEFWITLWKVKDK